MYLGRRRNEMEIDFSEKAVYFDYSASDGD